MKTDPSVHTLDALKSYLHLQRRQLELSRVRNGVWSEPWNEAWGGEQVLRHLENILENGTWNGEVYVPSE